SRPADARRARANPRRAGPLEGRVRAGLEEPGMILRAALAAALLMVAGCGSTPPGAISERGAEIEARLVGRFVHHRGEAREMVFTPNGRLLAATGTDGRIELMRGGTGSVVRTI